jgi:hypothetical protein
MRSIVYKSLPRLVSVAVACGAVMLPCNASNKTLKLTETNNGQTLSAVIGTVIEIDLSPTVVWSEVGTPVTASAAAARVVQRLSSATSADGGAHAVFRVLHAGNVSLESIGRAKCESNAPCPMFVRQWSVLVTVPEPL